MSKPATATTPAPAPIVTEFTGTPSPTAKRVTTRENRYARIWEEFVRNTKDHTLTVLQDDGLHRRMRVGAPGTGMYSWAVVTWPGYFQMVGDIADGYGFSREPDMIDFFAKGLGWQHEDGSPAIDVRYWAQKLTGGRSGEVRSFQRETFLQSVRERLEENEDLGTDAQAEYEAIVAIAKRACELHHVSYDDYVAELTKNGLVGVTSRFGTLDVPEDASEDDHDLFGRQIPPRSPADRRAEILAEARLHDSDEREAYEWLREHTDIFGEDVFEIGMRDYDYHFVVACFAISLTVKLWREYEQSDAATAHRNPGDDHVIVRGGIVQNDPALPVFDLDVLDTTHNRTDVVSEVWNLYERLVAHPAAMGALASFIDETVAFIRTNGTDDDRQEITQLEATRHTKSAV